jgi:hypothetical protein
MIRSRHGNEHYVFGMPYTTRDHSDADISRTVIERKTVKPADGAPYTTRGLATAPIGQSASLAVEILEASVKEGVYRMPSTRSQPVIENELVGIYNFACNGAAIDPGGRYILVLDAAAGSLYRINLMNTSVAPTVVLTSAQVPELAIGRSLTCGRLADDGFKRFVIGCEDGTSIMLVDSDNDAVFEAVDTLSLSEWDAAGFTDLTAWEDDYVNYSLGGLF